MQQQSIWNLYLTPTSFAATVTWCGLPLSAGCRFWPSRVLNVDVPGHQNVHFVCGTCDAAPACPADTHSFYVTHNKQVAGCAAAQPTNASGGAFNLSAITKIMEWELNCQCVQLNTRAFLVFLRRSSSSTFNAEQANVRVTLQMGTL
jgi:hypothetical protein